jgi:hypothetical protein
MNEVSLKFQITANFVEPLPNIREKIACDLLLLIPTKNAQLALKMETNPKQRWTRLAIDWKTVCHHWSAVTITTSQELPRMEWTISLTVTIIGFIAFIAFANKTELSSDTEIKEQCDNSVRLWSAFEKDHNLFIQGCDTLGISHIYKYWN